MLERLHARLTPPLMRIYPGLAVTMLALAWLHLGFGIEYVGGFGGHRNAVGVFIGLKRAAPMWVWGVAHLTCCAFMLGGLYSRLQLSRRASQLSVLLFCLMSFVGLWTACTYDAASFGTFFVHSALAAIAWRCVVAPAAIIPMEILQSSVQRVTKEVRSDTGR